MEYIELSHTIKDGLSTFPNMPPVLIDTYLDRDEAAGALLDRIQMINISGTYLDAPLHTYNDGNCIADIPLDKLVDLPVTTIQIQDGRRYFDVDDFIGKEITGGAVLLCSYHYKKFDTDDYGLDAPYLTLSGAHYLLGRDVVFIGIDSPLIDDINHKSRQVHEAILGAEAIVCENLTNLESIKDKKGLLTAVPPRIEMSSFPVRVYFKTTT